MSRKEELSKLASLFRSQAKAMSSRPAKQAFLKMADYYEHEAELLLRRPAPEIVEQSKTRSIKSAA